MKSIGTMTVIRGNGDVEVIMNAVVSAEIKRLREHDKAEMERERKEFEREMEWMNMVKKQRNRLLEEKCKAIEQPQHETLKDRTREKIGFVLACILCWGEELRLWEYIGDDDFWREGK